MQISLECEPPSLDRTSGYYDLNNADALQCLHGKDLPGIMCSDIWGEGGPPADENGVDPCVSCAAGTY